MDYEISVYLDAIPGSFIEQRVVNGTLQDCIVVPTKTGSLYYDKHCRYLLSYEMSRTNARSGVGISHSVRFLYKTKVDFDKAVATGWIKKSDNSGFALPKIPKANEERSSLLADAMEIYLDGSICLDYISEADININPYTGDKTITAKLITTNESGSIFTCIGVVYLNRLCAADVIRNSRTGRKNVKCYLKKLAMSDSYNSTHALLLFRNDRTEVEIGRFKQVKDLNIIRQRMKQYQAAPPLPQEPQPQPQPQIPVESNETPQQTKPLIIDGFKF